MQSTLQKLPPPDEVHRELLAALKYVATLRKLLRLSQRADDERQRQAQQRPAESEVSHE